MYDGPPGVCIICMPPSSSSFSRRGRRRAAILILCEVMRDLRNRQCRCGVGPARKKMHSKCRLLMRERLLTKEVEFATDRRDGSRVRGRTDK